MMEASLVVHVVHMYLEQWTQHLTTQMKNIKDAICSQLATPSTSAAIDPTSTLFADQMKYAKHIKPNECRMEAMKSKMESFLASLSDSEQEEGKGAKKETRKIERGKEAQEVHKKMCEKAIDNMDLLSKVDSYLEKLKK